MQMSAVVARSPRRLLLVIIAIAAITTIGKTANAGPAIVVNSTAHPGNGVCDVAECTIDEAITAANANAGVADLITFDPAIFPPGAPATISPATALPPSTDAAGVTISGFAAGVIVDGSGAAGSPVGLLFHTSAGVPLADVAVRSLTVQNFAGGGIKVCGGPLATCDEDVSGTILRFVDILDNGSYGAHLTGDNVTDTEIGDCESIGNTQAGLFVQAQSTLDGTTIDDCTSSNNDTQAIQLRGGAGVSNTTISDVIAFDTTNDALWVRSPSGSVSNTTVDGLAASNVATGLHLDAADSVMNATITDVTLDDNTTGIKIETGTGDVTSITLLDVETSRSSSHGMLFHAGGAISSVSLSDCNSNDNGDKGIEVLAGTGVDAFEISSCSASGNTNHGINVRPGSGGDLVDLSLESVVANNNGSYGVNPNAGGSDLIRFTVLDVETSGNALDGVYANGGGGDVIDASIDRLVANENASDGLDISTSGMITSATVSQGTFLENTDAGVAIDGVATLRFNRISGNGIGVRQEQAGPVDALNNWWGCNGGHGDPLCDSFTGFVLDIPWLLMTFTADPASIAGGQTADLTAHLNVNSDGADTSGLGHIRDGTGIQLTTDLASIGSSSVVKQTAGGSASATLTADEGPGTANLSAALDNALVGATVTITSAPPVGTPTPTPTPVGQTPTPTPIGQTPTATPTPGANGHIQGDNDCDGDSDAVDALVSLQQNAGFDPNQQPNCPNIGGAIPAGGAPQLFGDIDCDDDVDAVDALQILRNVAGLPVNQAQGCTPIGQPL